MIVVSSRCPGDLTRRMQKPFSSLWKVTRSITLSNQRFLRHVISMAGGLGYRLRKGFYGDWVAGWWSGRVGRFRATGSLLYHSGVAAGFDGRNA
jgi:hypothetical protein